MLTKKQIRLEKDNHVNLKIQSATTGKSIQQLANEILRKSLARIKQSTIPNGAKQSI